MVLGDVDVVGHAPVAHVVAATDAADVPEPGGDGGA